MAPSFPTINRAYNKAFQPDRLTLGLVVPIESYAQNPVPSMERHVERVRAAEAHGFSAVWLRDVPFNVPSFGDAGQLYDPFVYLGFLAAQTKSIALGVASIVLPLRHPAHVAKAAASVDDLSGGRLLLGVASGDRPEEYPALNLPFAERGELFRESFEYIRRMRDDAPAFDNVYGCPGGGMDMLPKPAGERLPMLITGSSRQTPEWSAQHGDGWMTYPRSVSAQTKIVAEYRALVESAGEPPKPVMQSLYIDLKDREVTPQPIHLGLRLDSQYLLEHLEGLERAGVNHVALNLRFNEAAAEDTMNQLAQDILPRFGG